MNEGLEQFARRIRFRGQNVLRGGERMLREAALRVLTQVVISTPVDTGRARGNWQVSVGSPISAEIKRLDKVGNSTIAAGNTTIGTARSGDTIWIANNVPYIGRLNDGYSSQAPANFVELAIQRAQAGIRGVQILGP